MIGEKKENHVMFSFYFRLPLAKGDLRGVPHGTWNEQRKRFIVY